MAKPLSKLRVIYASHFPLSSESLTCYVKGAARANDIDEPKGDVVRLRLKRWSRHLGARKSEILVLGDALVK